MLLVAALYLSDTYVTVGLAAPDYQFKVDSFANATSSSLNFNQAEPLDYTFGGSYKGLAFSESLAFPQGSVAAPEGPAPKFSDTSGSYYMDKVGGSASLTQMSGFTMSAASGAAATALGDADVNRSDIALLSRSAQLWFNAAAYNLSLKNFFDPASSPSGSGVALLFAGSYDDLALSAQSPLVPAAAASDFGAGAGLTDFSARQLTVSGGAAAMLAFRRFYACGMLSIGGGTQLERYTIGNQSASAKSGEALEGDFNAALGYKGETYFSTLSVYIHDAEYGVSTIWLDTTRDGIKWVLGRRL